MNWESWLKRWGLDNLKLKTGFLEADLSIKDGDKEAAWKLYVELLTRNHYTSVAQGLWRRGNGIG